ncbi:hypothetical protein CEK25_013079 [Fusarium fujikuroi]|nr:hypothetical protein CEK25_013079 [Fusarium fujikuroi]
MAPEVSQPAQAMNTRAPASASSAHQGEPGEGDQEKGSVAPLPPSKSRLKFFSPVGASARDQTTVETIATAPNAKGLISPIKANQERPTIADSGKDPPDTSSRSKAPMVPANDQTTSEKAKEANSPGDLEESPAPNQGLAFSKNDSSNSMSVRNAELGKSSPHKFRRIGNRNGGKVYLEAEDKASTLYSMTILSKFQLIKRNKLARALTDQEIIAKGRCRKGVTLYHSCEGEEEQHLYMEYSITHIYYRAMLTSPVLSIPEGNDRF